MCAYYQEEDYYGTIKDRQVDVMHRKEKVSHMSMTSAALKRYFSTFGHLFQVQEDNTTSAIMAQ